MELFQLYYNLFRKSTVLPVKPSIPSNIVTKPFRMTGMGKMLDNHRKEWYIVITAAVLCGKAKAWYTVHRNRQEKWICG